MPVWKKEKRVMGRSFKFQAHPTKNSRDYLQHIFDAVQLFYNMANFERLDAYKKKGIIFAQYGLPLDKKLPKKDQIIGESQSNAVKYFKPIFPEYSDISTSILHATLITLDSAWKNGNKTLYQLDRLNDINYIEAQREKKKEEKKTTSTGSGKKKVNKPKVPKVKIVSTNPEDIFKFNENIKGAYLRRDLPEGNPYVNTNRIEELKFIPKMKTKDDRQTFTLKSDGWKLDRENNLLHITMGKEIKATLKFRGYRKILGSVKNISVTHDKTHKWWVIFSCADVPRVENVIFTGLSVGIDFGVRNVLADSDGRIVENPIFLIKSSRLIARAQRRLSRYKNNPESRKYKQAKKWLARAHEKIKNQRLYFAREIAKDICTKYDIIFLEDINIVGISRRRNMKELKKIKWSRGGDKAKNRKTLDAGIGIVRDTIKITAENMSKKVFMVPPRDTSQTCSSCGAVREYGDKLKLEDPVFICRKCGFELHRDVNAAIVILQKGKIIENQEPEQII